MELTPNDIRNFEFPGKVRGYDKDAVDNFREQVALTLENLKQENLKLSMEIESVKTQLVGLKQFEDTIKDAAIDARRNADSTMAAAKKEAAELVAKAHAEADKQTSHLAKNKSELEAQVAKLDLLKKTYLVKLQGLIQSHLEWVTELTRVELSIQDQEQIAVTPMHPPSMERLNVESRSEITTKSRETIVSQPPKEHSRSEEANAASRLVTVDQLSANVETPKAAASIDPELAAALNSYQHAATAETKPTQPRQSKDTSKIDISTIEYQAGAGQRELDQPTGKVSQNTYEHSSVNIDTPINDQPPTPQAAADPDPNSLANVLDNVVHKFEEEMDKAAKN